MKLVDRHLCSEFFRAFLVTACALFGLFFVVDFFEKIGVFLKYDPEAEDVLLYFACRLPWIASQVIPMATLLATALSLTFLSRSGAVAATRSAGVSLRRLALPYLACGLALSAVTALIQEVATPSGSAYARHIKQIRIKKHPPAKLLRSEDLWLRSGGRILHIDRVVAETGVLLGVSVAEVEAGRVLRRLDAREARWEETGWVLKEVVERAFGAEGTIATKTRDVLPYPIADGPEDFHIPDVKPDDVPWTELRAQLNRDRARGLDTRGLEVDLWAKTSLPFMSLLMPLSAFPFVARTSRRKSPAMGVLSGVALGVSYRLVLAVGLSAGKAGALPPPLAAWAGNLVFLTLGGFLLWRVEYRGEG